MASTLQSFLLRRKPEWVATGVYRLPISLVNVYFVGTPGAPWVLVDTGIPGSEDLIRDAANHIFGEGAKPEAIVLTHGHFDHAGSLQALTKDWDVPVYAHAKEIPFLIGQSNYPPADPTVGGFGGQMSRFYTNKSVGLINHPQELPKNNSVPGLPGWRWIPTPGHTPGHVSFFREQDRVLLAGDAITSLNQHDLTELISKEAILQGPPAYFTPDWVAALRSVDRLAALQPRVLASGHGKPIKRETLALELLEFADRYYPPQHGRYALNSPHYDDNGLAELPPPIDDPLPRILAGAGIGVLAGLFVAMLNKRSDGQKRETRRIGKDRKPVLHMEKRKELRSSRSPWSKL